MPKVEVYDPPLCCPTGICGPDVDPVLVQFAADLEWLKDNSIEVQRFNLAQQPDRFVTSTVVNQSMALAGEMCLPIILVDGEIAFRNRYPSRQELAQSVGMELA